MQDEIQSAAAEILLFILPPSALILKPRPRIGFVEGQQAIE